jgi:hypothetical protein
VKGNDLKARLYRYRQIKLSVIGRKSERTISIPALLPSRLMRAMVPFLGMGILLLSCFSSSHPQPRMTDTGQINLARNQSSDVPVRGIYAPDPDHVWNRLFRLFYVRHTRDGRQYGGDELDPYLWPETKHLLSGSSHDEASCLMSFLSNIRKSRSQTR